ncbi:MAG: DMT family transporter [Pseudomonadota bacterium]
MTSARVLNRTMTPVEWLIIILLSVLWGSSFFFIEIALQDLPVFTIIVGRLLFAALLLLSILYLYGQRLPKEREIWICLCIMALINNVLPFSLIVWGQTYITSGVASILNATAPLFTVIVAHFMTQDEKLSIARVLAVLIGFLGVVIMIGFGALKEIGVHIMAQLACLTAALCYALAGVFGRRFRELNITPLAIATGQTMAASLILLPFVFLFDKPWTLPMPSLPSVLAVLSLAVFSTAFAYIFYFRVLQTAGAVNLLLVTFLIPVSAILLGVLILDEALQLKHIIGMGLIGVGLIILDGRLWQSLRKRISV